MTGSQLEHALKRRREWQRERGSAERLIVVLDEIERVLPRPGHPDLVTKRWIAATGALRALGQSEAKRWLTIVAADLRRDANRINQLPTGETNPFFKFFVEQPLPMLTRAEVAKLLRGIGQMMGVLTVDDDFIDALHAAVGGHPALVRTVAAAAADARGDSIDRLTHDHLEAGLEALADDFQLGWFFEQNFWGPATREEKDLLHRAARAPLEPPSKYAPERKAWAELHRQGLLDDGAIPMSEFREWVQAQGAPAAAEE